jgi:hypothetical protein
LELKGLKAKKIVKPIPMPNVGLVTEVMIPVAHPVKKSSTFNCIKAWGMYTDCTTALIITALKDALGVGLMMLM